MQPRHPERRSRARGTPEGEPHRAHLVTMIAGTYAEMPGLSLRIDQAARLFGLRRATCAIVLSDLVTHGTLRRREDGQYCSAELDGPARTALGRSGRAAARTRRASHGG